MYLQSVGGGRCCVQAQGGLESEAFSGLDDAGGPVKPSGAGGASTGGQVEDCRREWEAGGDGESGEGTTPL